VGIQTGLVYLGTQHHLALVDKDGNSAYIEDQLAGHTVYKHAPFMQFD